MRNDQVHGLTIGFDPRDIHHLPNVSPANEPICKDPDTTYPRYDWYAEVTAAVADSASLEHRVIRAVLPGMVDPFEKAERWRSRAEELRDTADGMQEPDTRAGLLDIADGLDHHARALEAMAIRLHCTGAVFRKKATEVVSEDAD